MESLEQRSKLPEVIQIVCGRSEELCVALNHEIISVCVFGHEIRGEANRKRRKIT